MRRMEAVPAWRRKALWPGASLRQRIESKHPQIPEGCAAPDPREESAQSTLPACEIPRSSLVFL